MENKSHLKKILWGIGIFILIVSGIILYARFIGTSGLYVKEYKVTNSSIPDSFYGTKIVQISDIHYGRTIKKQELQNMVNKVNQLKPDIIVLTGDLIDKDTMLTDKMATVISDILKQLNGTIGKYAITGNHDYKFDKWATIISDSGFMNLNDRYDIIYNNSTKPIFLGGLSTNTYQKEKTLEEIEPLLAESLKIREKYWPGTISEAASCHLYAKTLSNYENKLDYAIQLEKRAYSIFTKLQPGGVNVSSAAYILGWLYVQTAEDDEDIEFGIKNLEEAKNIRMKYRGDPLHSWMEDIYLKLGLAYEKFKNDQKAKEYFELLLKVRTNKFKDNPSQRQLIEVYELLKKVYSRLGDNENMKKCKKYLRYYG